MAKIDYQKYAEVRQSWKTVKESDFSYGKAALTLAVGLIVASGVFVAGAVLLKTALEIYGPDTVAKTSAVGVLVLGIAVTATLAIIRKIKK